MSVKKGDEFELTRETMELFIDGTLTDVPIKKLEVVTEKSDGNVEVKHYKPNGENARTLTIRKSDILEAVQDGTLKPI
jgi:hypothetical protein